MKRQFSFFHKLDQLWCGNCQISALSFLKLTGNQAASLKLAWYRLGLFLSLLSELVGYFLMTYGLAKAAPTQIFLIGLGLKIGGVFGESFFQNNAGVFLFIELEKYLERVKINLLEIRSFLTNQGCTEVEINSLQSIPGDVYQTELNPYQLTKVLNIGIPIACGLALFLTGDILISAVVMGLGLLAIPIGERFFKESTFRRDSEIRLGIAAEFHTYVEKIYKEHIALTTKVNLLSQLPLLLFAVKFIWTTASGNILSAFFALTQGLVGLTGTLAFQRARVAAIRTTETATHLIQALSSSHLIATPQRWQEHCFNGAKEKFSHKAAFFDGTVIHDFSPFLPKNSEEIFNLTLNLPSGGICFLKAPSGKGKSTFLSALFHLTEHKGDLVFLRNGEEINVHSLTREELNEKIFFFREENVKSSARIVDLFKSVTIHENESILNKAKQEFNPVLIDLAWKTSDNLLEQEIRHLDDGRQSVFPQGLKAFLKNLREGQLKQVQKILASSSGNLSNNRIHPERNFFTLSSGERRRLVPLLAFEHCKVKNSKIQLVVFDEPFTHLDQENILFQTKAIRNLQDLQPSPSILTISHYLDDEIKISFAGVQEVVLD